MGVLKNERGHHESELQSNQQETLLDIADFKMEGGHEPRNVGSWKGKERDSP